MRVMYVVMIAAFILAGCTLSDRGVKSPAVTDAQAQAVYSGSVFVYGYYVPAGIWAKPLDPGPIHLDQLFIKTDGTYQVRVDSLLWAHGMEKPLPAGYDIRPVALDLLLEESELTAGTMPALTRGQTWSCRIVPVTVVLNLVDVHNNKVDLLLSIDEMPFQLVYGADLEDLRLVIAQGFELM